MRIEPVSAVDLLPIAALITFWFLEALITVDFDTFEPSTVMEPTEALALLPIAALITFLFFDALMIVDLETFDPSAMAEKEVVAARVKTRAETKVFIIFSCVVLFKDRYSVRSGGELLSEVFTPGL